MIVNKKIVTPKYFKVLFMFCRNRMILNNRILQFYRDTFDMSPRDIIEWKSKYPRLNLMDIDHVSEAFKVLKSIDIDKTAVMKRPAVLIPHASSLKLHARVLKECGFSVLEPQHLINYYGLMKKYSIKQLKEMKLIPKNIDIYEHLSTCFSEFQSKLDNRSICHYSLYRIRMIVMQEYLESKLCFDKRSFNEAWNTYFQFRHRPLRDVETSLDIARHEINIPLNKIASYPYVVCADPENTRKILDEIKDFNGIDAREVLRTYPGVIRSSYHNILKINRILQENEISVSVLKRAYHIYTLNPSTVEKRLKEMMNNQILKSFSLNNRSLVLTLYKNKVHERLDKLITANKKCIRIATLLKNDSEFDRELKNFGDRSNPSEIIEVLMKLLLPNVEKSYYTAHLRNTLSQHCFWNCVPISNIIETVNMLLVNFSAEEILHNCHIVLYPYGNIKKYISIITELTKLPPAKMKMENVSQIVSSESPLIPDYIKENEQLKSQLPIETAAREFNSESLTNRQILALALYLIEKEHYFSGDGIWNKESQGNENVLYLNVINQ